jgi:hypothetical protein
VISTVDRATVPVGANNRDQCPAVRHVLVAGALVPALVLVGARWRGAEQAALVLDGARWRGAEPAVASSGCGGGARCREHVLVEARWRGAQPAGLLLGVPWRDEVPAAGGESGGEEGAWVPAAGWGRAVERRGWCGEEIRERCGEEIRERERRGAHMPCHQSVAFTQGNSPGWCQQPGPMPRSAPRVGRRSIGPGCYH